MKAFWIFVLAICGASAASVDRISGGSLATNGQFPSAVSIQHIYQQSPSSRGHVCGGTLVTRLYVLTTATCVLQNNDGLNPTPIILNQYRVFAGHANLLEEDPNRIRTPVNVTVHPNYIGPPALVNNLALLGLNAAFGTSIIPVGLASPASHVPTMTQCYTAGWGSTNMTTTESQLQRFISKYIYDQQICTLLYNTGSNMNIVPSMLCAVSWDAVSTGCIGDTGNGLMCEGVLHGVLSVTPQCPGNGSPEVYVRVSNYTNWIRSVTGAASTFQPGMAVLMMFAIVQFITVKIIS